MKNMFQNSVHYRAYQSASGCRSMPVYSHLQVELVLFQFDTVLAAVVYRAVHKLELNYLISIFINAKCN